MALSGRLLGEILARWLGCVEVAEQRDPHRVPHEPGGHVAGGSEWRPQRDGDHRVKLPRRPRRRNSRLAGGCGVPTRKLARRQPRPGQTGLVARVQRPCRTDVVTMEKIVALCKRRGFIFQSSEIYGGLASTYDYGHYGVLLKNNVKDEWWRSVIQERDDMVALDAAILMHPKTWEASGHLGGLHRPARAVPRRVQAALPRGPPARGAAGGRAASARSAAATSPSRASST